MSYRSKRHCGASLLFIVKEVALVNPELPATHPLANQYRSYQVTKEGVAYTEGTINNRDDRGQNTPV